MIYICFSVWVWGIFLALSLLRGGEKERASGLRLGLSFIVEIREGTLGRLNCFSS